MDAINTELTFNQCFEIVPQFDIATVAMLKQTLGDYVLLKEIDDALRARILDSNSNLMKRYWELVWIKVFGINMASQQKLAEL